MKILQINKFFYPRGGAEVAMFRVSELLRAHGHEVCFFSMQDEQNLPSEDAQYFVQHVDFSKSKRGLGGVMQAARSLYSFEAQKKLEALLQQEKPDVAHLHNIAHQLTPSILPVLKRWKIPIVMTLHDFQLLCPAYLLYNKRGVCGRCERWRYDRCIRSRCVKDSWTISTVASAEVALHRLLKTYERYVDCFIAPSRFVKDTFERWGFQGKLFFLQHFLPEESFSQQEQFIPGDGVLYAGRISSEKGIMTLMRVARQLTEIPFTFVGDGPLLPAVKKVAPSNVRCIGRVKPQDVRYFMEEARIIVVPSESPENSPNSVMEAMALGKPTIASCIGGIPELVEDNTSGVLFQPGDEAALVAKIRELYVDPARLKSMGVRARQYAREHFDAKRHYQRLMDAYNGLVNRFDSRP